MVGNYEMRGHGSQAVHEPRVAYVVQTVLPADAIQLAQMAVGNFDVAPAPVDGDEVNAGELVGAQ